jgi:hypothetical protein
VQTEEAETGSDKSTTGGFLPVCFGSRREETQGCSVGCAAMQQAAFEVAATKANRDGKAADREEEEKEEEEEEEEEEEVGQGDVEADKQNKDDKQEQLAHRTTRSEKEKDSDDQQIIASKQPIAVTDAIDGVGGLEHKGEDTEKTGDTSDGVADHLFL